MKKCISVILVVSLLMSCMIIGIPQVHAAQKPSEAREIAIVFDNSGSMYIDGLKAWCQATYAMEVFASMLNEGDTLWIYPMHPIEVDKQEYTMESPLKISEASQATKIRDIYTKKALGTPIESVDCAIQGLKQSQSANKYLIVLTDGEAFYRNVKEMSASATKKELDARFKKNAGADMKMMYLGIGKEVVMPGMAQSEYFVKRQAKNSEDVLSVLTEMCNQIFGRDTLPDNRITSNKIEFDLSMSKLIVFVQGENVSKVKVTGSSGEVGKKVSESVLKYGERGCGNYESVPDKSLQGMMVTYEDCAAGSYTIEHSGTASSIEVYYEPAADLDFVFTDAMGKTVKPKELYEGEYKVSFGMKDAKTGELISSDLLGESHYRGSYYINGTEYTITHDGASGEVPITLKMNDTFDAELTVTYLSGYTITKDSSDFGWPDGGIQVRARPAGDLVLEITGGDKSYSLPHLEEGKTFTAKVFYQGKQLTGDALKSVKLEWNPENSNAEVKKTFAEDHYKLSLHYKDPDTPKSTKCGECTVFIYASYVAQGSKEAQTQAPLTYCIDADLPTLKVEVFAPQDYIVISKLDDSQAVEVRLTLDGKKLTPEQFRATTLQVDCNGIDYKLKPNEKDSSYLIQLKSTKDIEGDTYPIQVTAKYKDTINRTVSNEGSTRVVLSRLPMWLKWLIALLILLLLILLIRAIMRIRVLPKKVRHVSDECSASIPGMHVDGGTEFLARRSGRQLKVTVEYGGELVGIVINNIEPAKDSYLSKPTHKRKILVKPQNVSAIGTVRRADINGVSYILNKDERLVPEEEDQPPFIINHASIISFDSSIEVNGRTRSLHAEIPLTFKK